MEELHPKTNSSLLMTMIEEDIINKPCYVIIRIILVFYGINKCLLSC